jgi:hypothetical protein
MSIETDESLWPEGAQWYAKKDSYHLSGFYKQHKHQWWFMRMRLAPDGEWIVSSDQTKNRKKMIPRPKAPWPQVGDECEYSLYDGDTWKACKIIGIHEDFIWFKGSHEAFTAHRGNIKFRPIRTLRDDLIKLLDGYDWLADSVLEKYELKEKTK